MNTIDHFTGQPYLNLETFRRSGQAMRTPVWFVRDGEKLYIRTVAESGKVKRVRNNPRVRIAVCGREGQLLGDWLPATAREVRDDPRLAANVDELLDTKYGEVKRQMARQAAEAGRAYTILEIEAGE
jgi:PPOX class probable F420-dependent enzyme